MNFNLSFRDENYVWAKPNKGKGLYLLLDRTVFTRNQNDDIEPIKKCEIMDPNKQIRSRLTNFIVVRDESSRSCY